MTTVAGTPSHIPPVASLETLDQLEYVRALDLVAAHAVSDLGSDSQKRPRTGAASTHRYRCSVNPSSETPLAAAASTYEAMYPGGYSPAGGPPTAGS